MAVEDRRLAGRAARASRRSFVRDALVEATGALIAASVISIVVAFLGGGDYSANLRLLLLAGPPILLLLVAALVIPTVATAGLCGRLFPDRRRYGVLGRIGTGLLTGTIWLVLVGAALIGWMILTGYAGQWAVSWINDHPEFP